MTKSSEAQEMWFEAKRRTQKGRRKEPKKKELGSSVGKKQEDPDVYDDIEGAHNVKSGYLQRDLRRKPSSSKGEGENTGRRQLKSKTSAGLQGQSDAGDPIASPQKKDLLKSQSAVNSSPQAPAPGSFFKQFQKRLPEQTPATNGKLNSIATTNGDRDALKRARNVTPESTEDESEDDSEAAEPGTPENANKSIVSKGRGWVQTSETPKKTIEDEIKELEEKAKREIKNDGSEDELAAAGISKRASLRRPTSSRVLAKPVRAQKDLRAPAKRTVQQVDRRKSKTPEKMDEYEIPESDSEVPMEVDIKDQPTRTKTTATPQKVTIKAARAREPEERHGFHDEHLQSIRRMVLEKATGKRPIPLANLEDEYMKVSNVISQTITAGESNSMLLIGSRGSGKSALVNQVLREQRAQHADDFHVVRLNGFIHTDDKIALREIWRQLGKEMELDEEEATSKNYADTMTRLLALLSHPTEVGLDTEQVTKSVIFVLDEFELFAGHPRQTLLYNLFDIAQSRKAPIAVIGLTTRIDVAEALEKRVKSRFSHRYVHLGMSKNLQAFEQICKSAASLSSEELTMEERTELDTANTSRPGSDTTVPDRIEEDNDAIHKWNQTIEQLLSSPAGTNFIRRIYHTTKSVPEFLAWLASTTASLPTTGQTPTSMLAHLTSTFPHRTMQGPDSKISLLPSFGTLPLALLICAARLTNIYNTETISFALSYEEYKTLASKAKLQASASGAIAQSRVWGKEVAKRAWEEVVESGMIIEDGRAGGTGKVDIGLEEIGMSGVDLGSWGKWCREI
jgi:origin recognition complex subunit 4